MRPLLLVTLLVTAVWTALPRAQDPQEWPADPPIFRLGVSIVQLDAVVTDRQGRHVSMLGANDFEVLQNGKAQPVTAVSYVRTHPRRSTRLLPDRLSARGGHD